MSAAETLREAAALMRERAEPMVPAVTLAVADWLDDQARYWDTVDADPSYGYMEGDPALAVARAYLGEPSP